MTEALNNEEFETVLVAGRVPEGEEDMGYFAQEHGVEPVFIEDMSRELSVRDIGALFKIWRVLVDEKPDIVHTHTAKAGTLGRIATFFYKWLTPGTLLGKPRNLRVFHTFHGHIFNNYYGTVKTKLFLFIEKCLAAIATDKIVVISDRQFEEISGTYGVGTAGQFEVIPLGLDLDKFTPDENLGAAFRKEIGVEKDEFLIGIVGRLTEIKNHRLFIEAVGSCRNDSDFSGVRFVIIGDGQLKDELESLAEGTGIIFAGNRDDANAFYTALDLIVLTSLNEGTPLTIIEAMAFGKPWVASNVGGVFDLAGAEESFKFQVSSSKLDESSSEESSKFHVSRSKFADSNLKLETWNLKLTRHGVLFESCDVKGLIEGMRLLVLNKELRDEMGGRGKDFVQKNYSKARLVRDIGNLYRKETND